MQMTARHFAHHHHHTRTGRGGVRVCGWSARPDPTRLHWRQRRPVHFRTGRFSCALQSADAEQYHETPVHRARAERAVMN